MARSPDGPDTGSVSGRLIAVVFLALLAPTLWLDQRGSGPQRPWPSAVPSAGGDALPQRELTMAPVGALPGGAAVTPPKAPRTILLPVTSTRGAAAREARGTKQLGKSRPRAKPWPSRQGSSSKGQAAIARAKNPRAQARARRGNKRSGAFNGGSGPGRPGPGLVSTGSGFNNPPIRGPLFQFKTVVDVPFAMRVVSSRGDPLPMARVTILAALAPPSPGQTIEQVTESHAYFDGFSGATGDVAATLTLPSSVKTVDLVVILPGYSGAYTHESLRAFYGPVAPSSRVTVPVAQLWSWTSVLEDDR